MVDSLRATGTVFIIKFHQWCAQNVFESILKAMVTDTDKYLLVQMTQRSVRYISTLPGLAKNMIIKQKECRVEAKPPKSILSSRKTVSSSGCY